MRCFSAGRINGWLTRRLEVGSEVLADYADQMRQLHLIMPFLTIVKFLSLEPLLGALPKLDLSGIDWVIVGGESGPGARPMDPSWAVDLRDQCLKAGVPFFFKQWGGV